MRRWLIATLAVLLATVALARSEGIYNPSSNSVGDYQGIDSNKPASGSTLACSYSPVTTGTQSVAYTGATPAASGGTPAYTFSETGALPTGLTINTANGVISGTPSVSGTFAGIQVAVTDSLSAAVNCGTSFTLVISAPAFQGPGDVVSVAALWGSCARVYNASLASTSTSLCDMVDSAAPTVVICTLRGSSSGFVDQTGTYCTGSVTPAAKCAAATGAKCNISKVYDQIGGTAGCTQATAATQPTLTFSAINSLPGMTGAGAGTLVCPNFIATQPNFTLTGVYKVTSAAATVISGFASAGVTYGGGPGANQATATAGTNITVSSITDNVFHAFSFVPNGGSSIVNIDNAETTAAGGAGAPSTNALRILSANGTNFFTGTVMEFGFWATTGFNGTQRTNMNSNVHGTNGYNF